MGNETKKPRWNFYPCHEASHFVLQEQTKREDEGAPHSGLADILNDWLVAYGRTQGHMPYKAEKKPKAKTNGGDA